ncbi:MAG: MotA/TolQ/ExbB proton channel family protein [Nitrosomonadales bacterium]|nr:MotA/TolQ/ExbB proton channel family protein [Nitrosomonadales bacterium]MBT3918158.1 MotA/TolQ/ExbB proton channel family protein [Nitrosomonadales bacterium]MBT4182564.1 MotA/TolQ/ExbB proton channel family protein [Nitrosomonadales bacterium]MBT4570843.1 MotA/TolQ/ExbB proton channel family protein [Nitrosomonadales bacterium]MBT4759265.1 MotA/TolQ/ExbB proton channel family protein [Nitrosomonadales bacterium]
MWEIIQAAGWPIWPLILTSVVGVAIVLERFWSLRKSQIIPEGLMVEIKTMIKQDNFDDNKIDILKNSSPLGDVLAVAILKRKNSVEVIKSAIDERAGIIVHNLERYLGVLVTIATVAPLLGLFGTIIGMVELFSSFTSSGHDVAVFARGISIALYNTAGGIVVAVPAMIAYRFFRSKIDNYLNEMEHYAIHLVEILKG